MVLVFRGLMRSVLSLDLITDIPTASLFEMTYFPSLPMLTIDVVGMCSVRIGPISRMSVLRFAVSTLSASDRNLRAVVIPV